MGSLVMAMYPCGQRQCGVRRLTPLSGPLEAILAVTNLGNQVGVSPVQQRGVRRRALRAP